MRPLTPLSPSRAAISLLLLVSAVATPATLASDAAKIFDRLKGMEGTWSGTSLGSGEAAGESADVEHVFELSANGTVVMETMMPGTDHEMINMYHLDGDDLVLTHYCAGGNQPTMKLNATRSTEGQLVFDFTGGTNLDATADPHIHAARLEFDDDGTLVSRWISWNEGREAGEMVFRLKKASR